MPKRNVIKVRIPEKRPDCCIQCPLLGIVPKHQRPKGSMETYVCIATRNAMTARLVRSKVSEADSKHPRHRFCERMWDAWTKLPNREFMMPVRAYIEERLPLEASWQLPIIFHSERRNKSER